MSGTSTHRFVTPRRALGLVIALLGAMLSLVVAAVPASAATFTNSAAITINDRTVGSPPGPASPYPSTISVSGLVGTISDLNVSLHNVSDDFSDDIDVLLEGPGGETLVLASDAGNYNAPMTNVTAVFDDAAAAPLPASNGTTPWGPNGSTVTVKPTNHDEAATDDTWPAPAPPGPYGNADGAPATLASVFNGLSGASVNGTWSLYVVDDLAGDAAGSIAGGWSLDVTTVSAAATTTTVTSSLNPSKTTQTVTFSAHVASGGSPVTEGTVTFSEGGNVLAPNVALNGSGQATFTTSTLTEGSHVITATYNGTASFATSTGSVTQVVDSQTQVNGNSFCNPGGLTIPSSGAATPYPSHIFVTGVSGSISKIALGLNGVSHPSTDDLDVLLVGPAGQKFVVVSDAGGPTAVSATSVTFDDDAATVFGSSSGGWGSGTSASRPVDHAIGGADTFPAPAPGSPSSPVPTGSATFGSVFGGTAPNGTWSLYVVDDALGDGGTMDSWCLTLTTTADAATTTTVTSSDNPSTVGSPVTFTAHVTSGGADVTAGAVTFRDGGTVIGGPTALSGTGRAAMTTSALTEGDHVITATYSGVPGSFNLSSGTLDQIVDTATTVTGATYCNPGGLTIPTSGAATPYASRIFVSGVSGNLDSLSVTLKGFSHPVPEDVDVLLVGPDGQRLVLVSDAGGQVAVTDDEVVLSDGAAGGLPATGNWSGTFRPTDIGSGDAFPAPAPAGPYGEPAPAGSATLDGIFGGTSPNGTWRLFVVDDTLGDAGSIDGWCLTLTVPPTAVDDEYDAARNTTLVVPAPGVLDNDTSFPTATAVPIASGATTEGGTVTLAADGGFTYDPPTDFTGDDTFDYQVSNGTSTDTGTVTLHVSNAPTVVGETLDRQQGSPATNDTIATVADVEDAAGDLDVVVGTVPTGIFVTNLGNAAGDVTADVRASCAAGTGAQVVPLEVTDSDGLTTSGSFTVDVTANTPPTLTYLPTSYTTGNTATADPATGPTDNGSVDAIVVHDVTPAVAGVTVDGPGTGTPGRVHLPDTAPGTYTVTIRATDNCGDHTDAPLEVTVNAANVAPTADAGGPYTIGEGDGLSLDGSASFDPDGDPLTYTWDVNDDGTYGDATGETPTLTWAALQALGIDDGPATFEVRVRVDDGTAPAVTSDPATLTLTNTAPTASGPATADAGRGVPFTLGVSASDPSTADEAAGFDWSVDWGDGSTGSSLTHTFAHVGTYTVTATATDKDGGAGNTVSTLVTVSGTEVVANPCGGGSALLVSGTGGADSITVKLARSGGLEVRIGTGPTLTFPMVARFYVYGHAGTDTITVDSKVTAPRGLYGGTGNDTINGGNGAGLQLGGDGDDALNGGNGRDILIGGTGADQVDGGNGDDLLVAGSTTYDAPTTAHQQALCAIESEWQSGSAYADRIAHLQGSQPGGLNGSTLLDATTVLDDSSADALRGRKGLDWFLLNSTGPGTPDTSDRAGIEVATDLG